LTSELKLINFLWRCNDEEEEEEEEEEESAS